MSLGRAFSLFSTNATTTEHHERSFDNPRDVLLFGLICTVLTLGTIGTFYAWYRMCCAAQKNHPQQQPVSTLSIQHNDIEQPNLDNDENKQPLLTRSPRSL